MGTMINRRRVMGRKNLLPTGYTQVNLITTPQNISINTKINPQTEPRVIMECYLSSESISTLFGNMDNGVSSIGVNHRWGVPNSYIYYGGKLTNYGSGSPYNEVIIVDFSKRGVFVTKQNGSKTQVVSGTSNVYQYKDNNPIYLFSGMFNGSFSTIHSSASKIGKFEVYEGDSIIGNCIPCYNPNGYLGWYNTITKEWFGSSSLVLG